MVSKYSLKQNPLLIIITDQEHYLSLRVKNEQKFNCTRLIEEINGDNLSALRLCASYERA